MVANRLKHFARLQVLHLPKPNFSLQILYLNLRMPNLIPGLMNLFLSIALHLVITQQVTQQFLGQRIQALDLLFERPVVLH